MGLIEHDTLVKQYADARISSSKWCLELSHKCCNRQQERWGISVTTKLALPSLVRDLTEQDSLVKNMTL